MICLKDPLSGCPPSCPFHSLLSSFAASHHSSSSLCFIRCCFVLLTQFLSNLHLHLPTRMALRLNPLPTQSFALPQMASLRSPKFRMASTLRSGSKSVLQLSDLLLLTQIMHSSFFSLPSFRSFFFFSAFPISIMPQTKPNTPSIVFSSFFSNSTFSYSLFVAPIPHVSFPTLMLVLLPFHSTRLRQDWKWILISCRTLFRPTTIPTTFDLFLSRHMILLLPVPDFFFFFFFGLRKKLHGSSSVKQFCTYFFCLPCRNC